MHTDAAASTAVSNDAPSNADGRTSSTTETRGRHGASSWRTTRPAGARGRTPVHAPQLVADLVVAQRPELAALVVDEAVARSPSVGSGSRPPPSPARTEDAHRGHTTTSASPSTDHVAPRDAERVGDASRRSGPTRNRPRRVVGTRYAARCSSRRARRARRRTARRGGRRRTRRRGVTSGVGDVPTFVSSSSTRPLAPTCSRAGCWTRAAATSRTAAGSTTIAEPR